MTFFASICRTITVAFATVIVLSVTTACVPKGEKLGVFGKSYLSDGSVSFNALSDWHGDRTITSWIQLGEPRDRYIVEIPRDADADFRSCALRQLSQVRSQVRWMEEKLSLSTGIDVHWVAPVRLVPPHFAFREKNRGSWNATTGELKVPFAIRWECGNEQANGRLAESLIHEAVHVLRSGRHLHSESFAEEAVAYTAGMCAAYSMTGRHETSFWSSGEIIGVDPKALLELGPERFAAMFRGERALRATFAGVALTQANRDLVLEVEDSEGGRHGLLSKYCDYVMSRLTEIDMSEEIPAEQFLRRIQHPHRSSPE
jgi:hypothetical protein